MLPQLESRPHEEVDGVPLRHKKTLSDATPRRAFGELKNLNQHPTTPRPKLRPSTLPRVQVSEPVFRVPATQLKSKSKLNEADVPPIDFANRVEKEEPFSALILDAPMLIDDSGICVTPNPVWFHHLTDVVKFSETEKEQLDAEFDELFPDSGYDCDMESDCSDLTMWEELPEVDTCNRMDDFDTDEELRDIFDNMEKVVLTDEPSRFSDSLPIGDLLSDQPVEVQKKPTALQMDGVYHHVKDQSPLIGQKEWTRSGEAMSSPASTSLGLDRERAISPFVVDGDGDVGCSAFDYN